MNFPAPRGPSPHLDLVANSLINNDAVRGTAYVPLEKILPHPELEQRTVYTDVQEMAASIIEHGQLQPVGLWEQPDGTYYLVWGYTRIAALRLPECDGREAFARIYKGLTLTKARELAFVENFSRQDLSLFDKAAQIRKSLADGWSQVTVAKLTGLDRRTIQRLELLATCAERSEAFAEAARLPGFPLRAAEVFNDLQGWTIPSERLVKLLPLLAGDTPITLAAFRRQLKSLVEPSAPPPAAPPLSHLRQLKNGSFSLSLKVSPGDIDEIDDRIEALQEALKLARKLRRDTLKTASEAAEAETEGPDGEN